jgi:hypothetical protein
MISLFCQNYSLLVFTGNFAKNPHGCCISDGSRRRQAQFCVFPVNFPVSREFCRRDPFDIDCVRHHAVLRKQRFPGSLRIAPNWRGFVRAFCLCKLSTGFEGSFWRLCLRRIKSRFPAADTGVCGDSVRMQGSVRRKTEHLVLSRPFGWQICEAGNASCCANESALSQILATMLVTSSSSIRLGRKDRSGNCSTCRSQRRPS